MTVTTPFQDLQLRSQPTSTETGNLKKITQISKIIMLNPHEVANVLDFLYFADTSSLLRSVPCFIRPSPALWYGPSVASRLYIVRAISLLFPSQYQKITLSWSTWNEPRPCTQ